MDMDDKLILKMVAAENDELRDVTGQDEVGIPTYKPVSYTSRGRVD